MLKTTNYKYLLNLAKDAKNASCTDDNYYLNKLVDELKLKVLKEQSFKTVVKSYQKKVADKFKGYYVINGTMYISDSESFIKIYKNGNNAVLLKDFKEIEHSRIKLSMRSLLDIYDNEFGIDITDNCITIDIFDTKDKWDYLKLSDNYKVDVNKLMYFAKINQNKTLNLYLNEKDCCIYVLSECHSFLGIIMPCENK